MMRRLLREYGALWLVTVLLAVKACLLVPLTGIGGGFLKEWFMNAGMALLLCSWLVFLPRRPRLWLAWAINGLLSLILVTDSLYWRFFDDIASMNLLRQVDQLNTVHASVVDLLRVADLTFVADLLIAAGVLAVSLVRRRTTPARTAPPRPAWRERFIVALLMAGCGGFLVGKVAINRYQHYGPELFRLVWSNSRFAQLNGPLAFHVNDLRRYLIDELGDMRPPTAVEKRLLTDWRAKREEERRRAAQAPLFGAARGASLLNIQLEAVQARFIDFKVRGQEITPVLNRLTRESIHFNRAYHQTAHGRTSDAELAVLCGVHPLAHVAAVFRYPNFPQRCLPEILRDELKMKTVAYHGHIANFWNRRYIYPRIGVERFLSREGMVEDETILLGISDRSMYRQVIDDFSRRERPFAAHIVTLTSHHPFVMPAAERSLDLGPWENTGVGNYMHAIHYTDRTLGEFIAALRRIGLWDSSLVVLYGDHDMGRVDQPEATERLFPGSTTDAMASVDFRKRVPLMFRLPGGRSARVISKPVGQIDIGPTIAHLLGLKPQKRDTLGHNGLDGLPRPIAFRDGSGLSAQLHYQSKGDGRFDTGRCHELATGQPVAVARCAELASAVQEELKVSDLTLRLGLSVDQPAASSSPGR